jgi:hypothetical protein
LALTSWPTPAECVHPLSILMAPTPPGHTADSTHRSATSALSPRTSVSRPRPTSRASRRTTQMTLTSPRTRRCSCARPRTGSRRITTPCSA